MKILSLLPTLLITLTLTACSTNKPKDDKTNHPNDKLKKEDFFPLLTKPEVRTIWVEDSIEGNKFIEKHRVFILQKSTSWSK